MYLRLDASSPLVAALEESVLAPNLDAAPGLGSVGAGSARSTILPVVNGVREADDPERQGLQSAVLGEGEPLNVTRSIPGGPDYSPVWRSCRSSGASRRSRPAPARASPRPATSPRARRPVSS